MKLANAFFVANLLCWVAGNVATAQIVHEMVERFESASWWQQTEVVDELIEYGDSDAVPEMERFLNSDDRSKRVNAAWLLAAFDDARGLPILINELNDVSDRPTEMIRSDGDPAPERQITQDRYAAAQLLGKLGGKADDAVPQLIEASREQDMAIVVALALGRIGNRSAVPALQNMLETFPEKKVWTASGLAMLGEDAGMDVLESVAVNSSDWIERRHAVHALGDLGRQRSRSTLRRAISDENVNVRISAIRAVGTVGTRKDLEILQTLTNEHESSTVNAPTTIAAEAAKAIHQINDRQD